MDGWTAHLNYPFFVFLKPPFFPLPPFLCLTRVNTHSDRNSTCTVQRVCKTPRRDSAVCLCFCWVFFLHRADAYTWKLGWQSAWQSAKTQTHTHRHTCCFWHQADRLPPLLMLFVLSVPPQSRHLRRALVNVETQRFLFEELTRPRCAAGPGDAAYLQ